MSEPYPHRSGTEEDLQKDFGSERLLIGFPVSAPSSGDTSPPVEEQPPAEEDQSTSS